MDYYFEEILKRCEVEDNEKYGNQIGTYNQDILRNYRDDSNETKQVIDLDEHSRIEKLERNYIKDSFKKMAIEVLEIKYFKWVFYIALSKKIT